MAYLKKLFNDNFLYYASYVIKDRAIPDLEDGLKPCSGVFSTPSSRWMTASSIRWPTR